MLSPSIPSVLIPALPFVLITNEMHVFSPGVLQNGQVPTDVQFAKLYLFKHAEDLKAELVSAKSMGQAAAEEWLKGLENRGKETRMDSARWEKWEAAGGVGEMRRARFDNSLDLGAFRSEATVNRALAADPSSIVTGSPSPATQSLGSYISTSTADPIPWDTPHNLDLE